MTANPNPSPVAFVLASGCNLGAAQVGMLQALTESDIQPDFVIGCSIGALNGAAFAAQPTLGGLARLEHLWRNTDNTAIMPRQWIPAALALTLRGEAIHPPDGLRQLARQALRTLSFEELPVRFHCVATDVVAGDEAWFDRGPLVDAVLASAAMPGMFPSVEIDGHRYVDGAVVNDIPITRAVELGARQIYVLEASPLSQSWSEPRRPLEAVLQAYWIARRNRFQRDLDSLADDIEVHVLGDGQPPTPPLHDLGRSAAMIHSAYMASAASLGQDKDPRGQKPSGRSGRSGGPNGQEPAGE